MKTLPHCFGGAPAHRELCLLMLAAVLAGAACQPSPPPEQAAAPVNSVPDGQAGPAGWLTVTDQAVQLAEITTAVVESREVDDPLEVSGSVQIGGDQQANVTTPTAGKVVRLFAGEGDDVSAGQALAIVESPQLGAAQAAHAQAAARVQARRTTLKRQKELAALGQFGGPQIEDARTRLAEAEREMREAERIVAEEKANHEQAKIDLPTLDTELKQAETERDVKRAEYERSKSLYEKEIIARRDLERAEADFRRAQADVDVAQARIEQGKTRIAGARERLDAAQGALDSARNRVKVAASSLQREEKVFQGKYLTSREIVDAEASLREAEVELSGAANAVRLLGGTPGGGNTLPIKAPISGKIHSRSATLGQTIDPEHAVFTIVNLNQVWVQLAVAPRDLPRVKVGDRVVLTSEATGKSTFHGRVLSISPVADDTTRSVTVRTTLENPTKSLRPGAFVRAAITTDVRQNRVMVPEGALQDHQGKPTLYVWRGTKLGDFEVRHVLLGVRRNGLVEVSDGILPGLKIAVTGTFYLKSEALKSSLSDGCCAPGG